MVPLLFTTNACLFSVDSDLPTMLDITFFFVYRVHYGGSIFCRSQMSPLAPPLGPLMQHPSVKHKDVLWLIVEFLYRHPFQFL